MKLFLCSIYFYLINHHGHCQMVYHFLTEKRPTGLTLKLNFLTYKRIKEHEQQLAIKRETWPSNEDEKQFIQKFFSKKNSFVSICLLLLLFCWCCCCCCGFLLDLFVYELNVLNEETHYLLTLILWIATNYHLVL